MKGFANNLLKMELEFISQITYLGLLAIVFVKMGDVALTLIKSQNLKKQSILVFTALVVVAIIVASSGFFWAKFELESSNNYLKITDKKEKLLLEYKHDFDIKIVKLMQERKVNLAKSRDPGTRTQDQDRFLRTAIHLGKDIEREQKAYLDMITNIPIILVLPNE